LPAFVDRLLEVRVHTKGDLVQKVEETIPEILQAPSEPDQDHGSTASRSEARWSRSTRRATSSSTSRSRPGNAPRNFARRTVSWRARGACVRMHPRSDFRVDFWVRSPQHRRRPVGARGSQLHPASSQTH
jgi:hypothetical protein